MSNQILQLVKTHIVDDGGLLTGYGVRYYKWTDTDLNGSGRIALFRMAGTGGENTRQTQTPDVSLMLLANDDSVRQADADLLAVLQYLRANYKTSGAFSLFPMGPFTGPVYYQNGRARFELVIRVGVEDH